MSSRPVRVRKNDWRTQVRRHEDLDAPTVEYTFSNGKKFKRRVKQSGLYT